MDVDLLEKPVILRTPEEKRQISEYYHRLFDKLTANCPAITRESAVLGDNTVGTVIALAVRAAVSAKGRNLL